MSVAEQPLGDRRQRAGEADFQTRADWGTGLGKEQLAGIQRSRMLAAIVEAAAERGSANVSVAHVTERSGTSRRTFYELFEDKEDCYLQAFDELVSRVGGAMRTAHEGGKGWSEQVRCALTVLLAMFESEPDVARLLIVDSLGAGPVVLERRRKLLEQLTDAVDRGGGELSRQAPPRVIAEGVVGAVFSVLHARVSSNGDDELLELVNPLTSIVVLPYMGEGAARRELQRVRPAQMYTSPPRAEPDPLLDLKGRLTYRTVRALLAIAAAPGASNREIGLAAGIHDQGQISKLLTRLTRLGLVCNSREIQERGAPNAWTLTPQGRAIQQAMSSNLAGGEPV
jgi:AcrR family transcriptional regulator